MNDSSDLDYDMDTGEPVPKRSKAERVKERAKRRRREKKL